MIPAILFYLDDMDLLDQQDENGKDVLSDSEYRKIMRAFKHYARTGEGPKGLSPTGMLAYTFVKQKIDREISKYNVKVENGRKGGKANGSKTKRTEAKRSETKRTEETKTKTVTETENKNVTKEREGNETGAEAPSLNQVKGYVTEKNLKMDPEAFFLYYQARRWMVGGYPVGDWRALCESWAKREGKIIPLSPAKGSAHFIDERDYTEEQMKRTTDADIMRVLSERKEAAN